MFRTLPNATVDQWRKKINAGFSVDLNMHIGDINDLRTPQKDSLVSAINSILASITYFQSDDYVMDGGAAVFDGFIPPPTFNGYAFESSAFSCDEIVSPAFEQDAFDIAAYSCGVSPAPLNTGPAFYDRAFFEYAFVTT